MIHVDSIGRLTFGTGRISVNTRIVAFKSYLRSLFCSLSFILGLDTIDSAFLQHLSMSNAGMDPKGQHSTDVNGKWSEDDIRQWGVENLRRWGLEDLRRWGKVQLSGWSRDELVKIDKRREIEKTIEGLKAQLATAYQRRSMLRASTQNNTQRSYSNDSGVSVNSSPRPSFMTPTECFARRFSRASSFALESGSSSPASGAGSSPIRPRREARERHDSDSSIMADTAVSRLKKRHDHDTTPLFRARSTCNTGWREEGKQWKDDIVSWDRGETKPNDNLDEDGNEKPRKCLDCVEREAARCEECKERLANGFAPFCQECFAQELKYADLVRRTRVSSKVSEEPQENIGPIPFEVQMAIKLACESLVKLAIWLALRKDHPQHQQRFFPEGPEQIRFGYADMSSDGFGSSGSPDECLELCSKPRKEAWNALERMVDFRNSIAHCHYNTAAQLSNNMALAQDVVCAFGNEEIALKIREMRDAVDERAKASGAEIVRIHGEILAGKDMKYPIHFQNFFMRCWNITKDTPGVIEEAAKLWRSKNNAVGKDDDFFKRLEEAEKHFQWRPSKHEDEARSCYADRVDSAGAKAKSEEQAQECSASPTQEHGTEAELEPLTEETTEETTEADDGTKEVGEPLSEETTGAEEDMKESGEPLGEQKDAGTNEVDDANAQPELLRVSTTGVTNGDGTDGGVETATSQPSPTSISQDACPDMPTLGSTTSPD